MTVLSLVSDTEKIANFCGAGQEIKRFYSHKFTIDKDIMRAIISTKIKTKSFIMAEQNVRGVPVVLTIKHIKDMVSYPIALLSESEINEFLLKMAKVKFCSKCFYSAKLNNAHHLGQQEVTRQLEIICFLDGKRSCFFDFDQAKVCLNKITSGKCECSDPFVIEHILPLLGKKNEK